MKISEAIPLSPFHCPIPLKRLARDEFDMMSREIMAHVFASQNELGRLCDESVYQSDIALRLQAAGFASVAAEVPMKVSLHDFVKTYRLDLVIENAFVVELKTTDALRQEHDSQLLNYLLILEVPHGKLINLRPASVEYRTINAAVSADKRRHFEISIQAWQPQTSRCGLLLEHMTEVLSAWGAFLDCHLYEEALIHFLGGEYAVLQNIPLKRAGFSLGTQKMPLVTDSVAFRLTALAPEASKGYEAQLRRFLALTPLQTIHWVNMHHHLVNIITLTQ